MMAERSQSLGPGIKSVHLIQGLHVRCQRASVAAAEGARTSKADWMASVPGGWRA